MRVEVEVEIDELIVPGLTEQYHWVVHGGYISDPKLAKAMKRVIRYYLTDHQYKEWKAENE